MEQWNTSNLEVVMTIIVWGMIAVVAFLLNQSEN